LRGVLFDQKGDGGKGEKKPKIEKLAEERGRGLPRWLGEKWRRDYGGATQLYP